jgi:hypothetical protein
MLALLILLSLGSDDPDDDPLHDEPLRKQLNDFAAENLRVRHGHSGSGNFTVLDVQPRKAPTTGGINITITVAGPEFSERFFCRFDAIVVRALAAIENEIVCQAPKHSPGQFYVSVSTNRLIWSDDFPFDYDDSGKAIAVVVAIIVGIAIISCALFVFQMRQCQQGQRKHRKQPAALTHRYGGNRERDSGLAKRRPERFL